MICMPKAERLMYASQGLCALTDVLITNHILQDISPNACAVRDEHLEGYLRAIQYLALDLERAIYDAWEDAKNPTYLNETDQKQARDEMYGRTGISTLTWTQTPQTVKARQGPAQ